MNSTARRLTEPASKGLQIVSPPGQVPALTHIRGPHGSRGRGHFFDPQASAKKKPRLCRGSVIRRPPSRGGGFCPIAVSRSSRRSLRNKSRADRVYWDCPIATSADSRAWARSAERRNGSALVSIWAARQRRFRRHVVPPRLVLLLRRFMLIPIKVLSSCAVCLSPSVNAEYLPGAPNQFIPLLLNR